MREPVTAPLDGSPKRQRLAPDERRAIILDVAQKLFFANGWDDVTVSDILTEADISKGGFYHHFSSKEDLFDGVIERFTTRALASANAVYATTTGDALTRFNAFFAETSRWKAEQGPQMKFFVDVTLRPRNDLLFNRIMAAASAAALPILVGIIRQGADDGTFDVHDVDIAGETIIAMSYSRRTSLEQAFAAAKEGNLEQAVALLEHRMIAEGRLIDRLLGLPQGSVVLANPEEHRLMLRATLCR